MPIDAAAGDLSNIFAQFQTFLDRTTADNVTPGQTGAADKSNKAATVGVGTSGATDAGSAPDASGASDPAGGGVIVMAAVTSLFAMMPPMQSSDDIDAHLASVEEKMKDTNKGIDKGRVTMDSTSKRAALEAKVANLQDASEKTEKAASEHKKASIADKVKLAFSYIGAVLTIAVGVIAIATGVGAVAGALLIAGGAIMLALAIDQTMAAVPGKDGQPGKGFIQMMSESITKDLYPNDPEKQATEAKKWEMGITFALMGVSMICTIAGSVVNPTGLATDAEAMATDIEGAASEGTNAASTLSKGASAASNAKTAATTTGQAKSAVGVAEGVNDAANTGTDVASTVYSYKADNDTAGATQDKAANKALDAVSNALDAAIDMLMARMKADGERFNAVIDTLVDAGKDRGESLSHVKFRA